MRESEHVKEHIKSFVRWRCLLSGMPDVVQKLKPPPLYHVPWECSTSQAKSVLLNPIRVTDVERLQSHNKILFSKFIDQVLGLWCQGCVKRPLVVNQPQIQHACCLVYQAHSTGRTPVHLVLSWAWKVDWRTLGYGEVNIAIVMRKLLLCNKETTYRML